jgi:hypothetical protein
MSDVKNQRAQVNVTLEGTPDEIRLAYRSILDGLDDMTDIYRNRGTATWGCHIHFPDDSWKRPPNQQRRNAFLTEDIDGFLPRS